jgi:hypothetical protein
MSTGQDKWPWRFEKYDEQLAELYRFVQVIYFDGRSGFTLPCSELFFDPRASPRIVQSSTGPSVIITREQRWDSSLYLILLHHF